MHTRDKQEPGASPEDTLEGGCPICGMKVIWTPTSQLWPSKRMTKTAMPGYSGTCSGCKRVLMFTVISDFSDTDKGKSDE
ncbi:MAG: hypothetical protein ACYC6O_10020 [Thermoleophilia bacterium]